MELPHQKRKRVEYPSTSTSEVNLKISTIGMIGFAFVVSE